MCLTKKTILIKILMKKNFYSLLITLLIINFSAKAQPGANDPTFNPSDTGFGHGEKADGNISAVAVQSDGKLIIGGSFVNYDGVKKNNIARLNADGSLDETFNSGTGANSGINTISIQSDGKIIIGGFFTSYNNVTRNALARLNADGSLDETFNANSLNATLILATAARTDGKVLVAGSFSGRIARLNTDGSIDATFTPGTGANASIRDIKVSGDKIFIGGDFTSFNGTALNRIARLNDDGILDVTFSHGTGANEPVRAMAVQADGKIIIGGSLSSYDGTSVKKICRLNTNGSLDGTFSIPSTGINFTIRDIVIQADGMVIAVGDIEYSSGVLKRGIVRFTSTGSIDAGFTSAGIGELQTLFSVAMEADGKIIIAGGRFTYDGVTRHSIARLNVDGSLHNSFIPSGTGVNRDVNSIAVQGDGKIIIAGDFSYYSGVLRNRIARLNADGSLDATFNASGSGANDVIWATAIQADGKIIIAGSFTSYNGTAINRVARLHTDGSLDGTFNPGTWEGSTYNPSATIYSIAIQGDGKIIIAGTFIPANSTSDDSRIARLNTNGSLDLTFHSEAGAVGASITAVAIQADGKILIGGTFSSYNGTARNGIARLDANGNLDATFNPGTGIAYSFGDPVIYAIAFQADGKIVIGGNFTSYNGTERTRIARIHADGSLDGTFVPATSGANNTVYTINTRPDGKIIIGGAFDSYGGSLVGHLAGLNSDGSVDNTFVVGTGANGTVSASVLPGDEKLLIGGQFTSYAGTGRSRIARLLKACLTTVAIDAPALTTEDPIVCPGNAAMLSISASPLPHGAQWKWYTGSCAGTPAGSGASITVSPATTTTYFARAEGGCVTPGSCASITISAIQPQINSSSVSCQDGTVSLIATATAGTIKWYDQNDLNIGQGSPFTFPAVQEKATYYAKAYLRDNCISANSPALHTGNTNNVTASVDGNTITANATNTTGVTYNWVNCNDSNAPTGGTAQQFTPSTDGSYAVIISDHGCYSTSDCIDMIITGAEEFQPNNESVFPNPGKGRFFVNVGRSSYKRIRVTDMNGKQVYEESGVHKGLTEILLSQRPGMYFLTVSDGAETTHFKIAIE
jgi:uncharacterized delta-60 repeat protein